MKYAVMCQDERIKYVCALVDTAKEANGYKKVIDNRLKPIVVKVKGDFPIWIVEDFKKRKIWFTGDFKEVKAKINKVKPIEGFEEAYFNYYIIKKRFCFKPIGTDKMGSLDHVHVTNDWMDNEKMMLFYPSESFINRKKMSHEELGCYAILLCMQKISGGEIDKKVFIKRIGKHISLKSKFVETKTGFYQRRLAKEMGMILPKCKKL